MDDLTRLLLERDDRRAGQVVYGVATDDNTVAVRGATTAVELPALTPVKAGDYCAVWESGADRLILGPVGGSSFSTTIAAVGNFTVTGSVFVRGSVAGIAMQATRTTSNIGATSAVIASIPADGRGSFTGYTQALSMRAWSSSALADALCWVDVSTGQITMQWFNTWNVGVAATFNGVVLL